MRKVWLKLETDVDIEISLDCRVGMPENIGYWEIKNMNGDTGVIRWGLLKRSIFGGPYILDSSEFNTDRLLTANSFEHLG